MAGVFGAIDLHQEPIGIAEFERLVTMFRARLKFQARRLDLGARFGGIPVGKAEIIVIQIGRAGLLFQAEKAFADRQDMNGGGLLRQLHAEKLLVEGRGFVQVRHMHGDMVEADGLEAGRRRGGVARCKARGHGRQAYRQLAAAEFSAFKILEHFFNNDFHGDSSRLLLLTRSLRGV